MEDNINSGGVGALFLSFPRGLTLPLWSSGSRTPINPFHRPHWFSLALNLKIRRYLLIRLADYVLLRLMINTVLFRIE